MGEDAPLELLQLASRLDPEPFDELRARLSVERERLALAPAAVKGEHQLRARALAERLLVRELLERAQRSPSGGPGRAALRRALRSPAREAPRAARSRACANGS